MSGALPASPTVAGPSTAPDPGPAGSDQELVPTVHDPASPSSVRAARSLPLTRSEPLTPHRTRSLPNFFAEDAGDPDPLRPVMPLEPVGPNMFFLEEED